MKSNWDKYLDPPDEPEAQYCDGCGEEKEIIDNFGGQRYTKCVNPYCPYKHNGVAKLIANELADSRATIGDLKREILHLKRLLTIHEANWEE